MSKIIRKLGLPEIPEEIATFEDCCTIHNAIGLNDPFHDDFWLLDHAKILLAREQQRRAMIEALIDACSAIEEAGYPANNMKACELVESITGKTWAEIKELLEGE